MKIVILLAGLSLLVCNMKGQNTVSSLNGRHLKTVAAELPLTFRVVRDIRGNVVGYGGPTYELIQWLSRRLNFTYSLHVLDRFDFGEQVNGSYTGLRGYLFRKESDIALSAFSYEQVNSSVDASCPWGTFDFSLLIPYPPEENKMWAALKPFRPQVWLCCLAALLCMALALNVNRKGQIRIRNNETKKDLPKENPETSSLMYLVGVITGQGGYLGHKGKHTRVLGTAWYLAAFVLVSAYSCLLVSFLSTTRLVPVADSLHEVSEKLDQLLFYGFKGSNADRFMMEAREGPLKLIGDYLRLNPGFRKQTGRICLEEASKQGGVCLTSTHGIGQFIYEQYKKTNRCELSRSKEIVFPLLAILLFQKHTPYAKELNYQILSVSAHGLTSKWFRDEYKIPYKCLERKPGQAKNQPLSLVDLSSAFLALAIGAPISVVAFVAELITGRLKRK